MNSHRKSQDSVYNNVGNILLEICKSNNLFILNGRCGKDKEAFVDYSITTAETLKFIDDFEITELDSLFSDGHSLLQSMLKFKKLERTTQTQPHRIVNHQPKWQENKKAEFILNLDDDKINQMQTQLQQAQNNLAYINKDIMNEFCTNISDIFTQLRAKTFQITSYHSENINDKRWFGPR